MFTLFVLFVFAWLFVKSVGLAFHVTWGLAKFVATLLFVIALPLLVVFAVRRRCCCLCCCPWPSWLPPSAFRKGHKVPNRRAAPELHGGFLSLRCRRGILVVRAVLRLLSSNKEVFPMKLVVCFPGIGYHCDKPLLYYSRKLAACAGTTTPFCCNTPTTRTACAATPPPCARHLTPCTPRPRPSCPP